MAELSLCCNIWAGTSECWVPLDAKSWVSLLLGCCCCLCWSLFLICPAASEEGSQPRKAKLSESYSKREKPGEENANYIFWPCSIRDGITHISHYSWSFPRAWIASGQGGKSGAFIVAAWLSYRMKYIPWNAFGQIQWFLAAICLL